ncbi:MAG: glycosyltransferase, partial [Leptolyngbyaceae cyanobacterium SL_5_9]|nr:glycosyltransferase [Leptolyngbyaceae cyanobacterium SL_5_9]NJO72549.1 glycosyltransferase [Leptolyngbyaceae cyanobacterium RM1_406_9]
MKSPKITLLTCTHNGERTLEQTLEAIANQTDVPRDIFEVLVVDNASSDRT